MELRGGKPIGGKKKAHQIAAIGWLIDIPADRAPEKTDGQPKKDAPGQKIRSPAPLFGFPLFTPPQPTH